MQVILLSMEYWADYVNFYISIVKAKPLPRKLPMRLCPFIAFVVPFTRILSFRSIHGVLLVYESTRFIITAVPCLEI